VFPGSSPSCPTRLVEVEADPCLGHRALLIGAVNHDAERKGELEGVVAEGQEDCGQQRGGSLGQEPEIAKGEGHDVFQRRLALRQLQAGEVHEEVPDLLGGLRDEPLRLEEDGLGREGEEVGPPHAQSTHEKTNEREFFLHPSFSSSFSCLKYGCQ